MSPTTTSGHRDCRVKDRQTDRIGKNNAGSILQKEVAGCRDPSLPMAGKSARLFRELTLEVAAAHGIEPVDTTVGRMGKIL